jgi:hypothetical protein
MKKYQIFILFLCCCSSVVRGQISGKVFHDFDANGKFEQTKTFQDKGQTGILVEAFNSQNELVSSEKTDADGNYTLNVPSGQKVRILFSKIPVAFVATSHGLTRFAKSPVRDINLGIFAPERYSEQNPYIAVPLYVNGNPIDSSTHQDTTSALVAVRYESHEKGDKTSVIQLAKGMDVGSIWGIAYDKNSQKLYSAAIAKRHAGYGSLGTGGIYVSDISARKTKPLLDLQQFGIITGENTHQLLKMDSTGGSVDSQIFKQIGKVSLGGIDISDNGEVLYVMNLYDRNLYAISKLNQSNPTIEKITLPNPKFKGGEFRPFAVKYYEQKVYIGMVCDAEISQKSEDLKAVVYEYDPIDKDFNKVLEIPLDYPRGHVTYGATVSEWHPWTDDFSKAILENNPSTVIYPQPILADIEFDTDGSMILGLMDRFGHQVAAGQPDPTGTANYAGTAAGDILRCFRKKVQKYDLEANASVGKILTEGVDNAQGPKGGEFYFEEKFSAEGLSLHDESGSGGLALIQGSNVVMNTVHEPTDEYGNAGIKWFSSTDGKLKGGLALLPSDKINAFSKVNAVGDIEVLSSLPEIKIANRIWMDCDEDGLQDPDEQIFKNVEVELWKGNNKITTTQSNEVGEYSFDNTNVSEGIKSYENYEIRIPLKQPLYGSLKLTKNITGSNEINSDAIESNGYALISLKTNDFGQNMYNYDCGFLCSAKPQLKTSLICNASVSDNKEAKLLITDYHNSDRFSLQKGSSFNEGIAFEEAQTIPKNGIILQESFLVNNPQDYTIRLFNASGCFTDFFVTLSEQQCAANKLESENGNFVVYPNPSLDKIKVDYISEMKSQQVSLHIYDLLGRELHQKQLYSEGNAPFKTVIDVSKYQTGSYVLSITDGPKKVGRVIIKE